MFTTGTMPPITIGNCTRPNFFEFSAFQRRVSRAESNGFGFDLLDAATGSDRLIVQSDAGLLAVDVRPFGVDGIGESRAGAGYLHRGGRQYRRGKEACDGEGSQLVH